MSHALAPIVALYGVIGDPWVATGVGFVESTGQALAFIGAAAAMAQAVPAVRAGASQGLMRAFGLLTATIAAALSGVVYEIGGPLALFGGTAIVVVLMIAGGLLVLRAARARAALVEPAGSRATAAPAEVDADAELSDERACAPTRA